MAAIIVNDLRVYGSRVRTDINIYSVHALHCSLLCRQAALTLP